MRTSLLFATLAAGTLAMGAALSVFGAPPPATEASASAYASASASATASASVDPAFKPYAPPPGPPVAPKKSTWVPPSEKSDKPDEKAWEQAESLELPRHHYLCSAKKIREWVRVECSRPPKEEWDPFLGIRVVGGSHVDVSVSNPTTGKPHARPLAVVFPVRKGDRRVMDFVLSVSPEWKSWTVTETLDIVVSEEWLEGDSSPTIAVN
jgi:hypothetical protein